MPPSRTVSDSQARRAMPFKPPSRVSSAGTAGTSRVPAKTTTNATIAKPSVAAQGKHKVTNATVITSDDMFDDDLPSDLDDGVATTRRKSTQSRATGPSTPRRATIASLVGAEDDATMLEDPDEPTIPRALLTRILQQGIEDKDVRIGKEAVSILEMYTKVFVKEAIARSRQEGQEKVRRNGGVDDGWLQVEDLEKIAPQLLLDF